MDAARKGEIALLVLKAKIRRDGVRLGPNHRRETGNAAKEIGITFEEAMEFSEELIREAVDWTFKHGDDPTETTVVVTRV